MTHRSLIFSEAIQNKGCNLNDLSSNIKHNEMTFWIRGPEGINLKDTCITLTICINILLQVVEEEVVISTIWISLDRNLGRILRN